MTRRDLISLVVLFSLVCLIMLIMLERDFLDHVEGMTDKKKEPEILPPARKGGFSYLINAPIPVRTEKKWKTIDGEKATVH